MLIVAPRSYPAFFVIDVSTDVSSSSVVRFVAFYSSECKPTSEDNERHLVIMQKKKLCWISGVKHYDRVQNLIDMLLHSSWKTCSRMESSMA